ncbi:hypothetical protein HanPI659440_Chr16g0648521 [Helianthus annuus]|nr:hypothetical protein HanPI659440_Chr16g0648521 [Helianthus annuus]
MQDKLTVNIGLHGNQFLCFKSNLNNQFVSHISQWQDIVMSLHVDADSKHLGFKETLERIEQVWTVGVKFYEIPESYIRACVAAYPLCFCSGLGLDESKKRRRRFEYTERFEVSAKDVADKLQQLAAKYKAEPDSLSKKSRVMKRKPYVSKRCGCGFRVRVIVPICNYNEKDKTFVYEEEGGGCV